MSWLKIIIAQNIPPVLYHATYGAFIGSILEQGLIPNYTSCWEGGCEHGVYLADKPYVAESYAETADNSDIPEEYFDDIIVLKIDTTQLDLSKLGPDPQVIWDINPENNNCYLYRDVIPVNAILNRNQFIHSNRSF